MTTCREIFTFTWPLWGREGGGQPKRSAWPLFPSFFTPSQKGRPSEKAIMWGKFPNGVWDFSPQYPILFIEGLPWLNGPLELSILTLVHWFTVFLTYLHIVNQELLNSTFICNKTLGSMMDGTVHSLVRGEIIRASCAGNFQSGKSRKVTPLLPQLQPFAQLWSTLSIIWTPRACSAKAVSLQ